MSCRTGQHLKPHRQIPARARNAAAVSIRRSACITNASADVDPSAVSPADREYMRQALDLARRGLGKTYPNPAVGCIIVKDGKVRRKPSH